VSFEVDILTYVSHSGIKSVVLTPHSKIIEDTWDSQNLKE
jgi:hypothetical protein